MCSFIAELIVYHNSEIPSIAYVQSHNIPLRIMLLFMTEVFDLKTRNQWLRKRIITLVRQIMQTMFGDIVNRRILDYMTVITSPSRVALCLSNIRYVSILDFYSRILKIFSKSEFILQPFFYQTLETAPE